MAIIKKYMNNFTAGELSPAVCARVDLAKYASGCKNITNGVIHSHGGISMRPGTEYIDSVPGDGILIPFVYSVSDSYVLLFYDDNPSNPNRHTAKMRVYVNGALVTRTSGGQQVPYVLATPFYTDQLDEIRFAQSADVIFFVHKDHPPKKLVRTNPTSWAFSNLSFSPSISAPTGLTATPSGFDSAASTAVDTTTRYKVAAVSANESESLPSYSVSASTKSTWPQGARVKLEWDRNNSAIRYEVYKNSRGYWAWIGSSDGNDIEQGVKFIDDNIEGDSSIGPRNYKNPFSASGKYPGVVGIYQQRLVFGRSNSEPQTVWCTEVGDFNSMAVSEPLQSDNAITATVDSKQMNEIRHFIPLRDMLMLTSGAEFKMGGGGEALSPTSIRFDIQSYWGASNVPPIVCGTSIVLVENSGKVVRDLHYSLSEDGYTGDDVSILAEHLLNSPVRDWAYQQSPWSTIWICLESGKLLSFTYMREQEVWAWTKHESQDAQFRSVSCIREGSSDNVYYLVKRGTSYFVEMQKKRDYGTAIEDSFFVDCGLKYEGSPASTITGLTHLAGKTVCGLSDGSVVKNLTVSAEGTVTLPAPASKVILGLPYQMTVETLDPDIKSENGTMYGEKKSVVSLTFQLRESRGLKAGPDMEHLTTVKFPPPAEYNDPPPLYTGAIHVSVNGLNRSEIPVVFIQDDPLPCTVLAVVTEISVR